jgi:F-type H+-transporting ATPase subunit epsilon
MATLRLEIVTPEGITTAQDVDMVSLPGVEGEMGIYPQHVPLMTEIVPGEIVARYGGADHYLAVGPGFVEITGNRVAVLTDMAIKADDLDEAKAEQARKAAEARLRERLGEENAAVVNAAIARSIDSLRGRRRGRK